MVAGGNLFLALLGISRDIHQIYVVRSGKVRENCAEKVMESQAIEIKLTVGNAVKGSAVRAHSDGWTDRWMLTTTLSPFFDKVTRSINIVFYCRNSGLRQLCLNPVV